MHQPPAQTGTAVWHRIKKNLGVGTQPAISPGNQQLHKTLLEITGRYLLCLSAASEAGFTYLLREDSKGFLKLDIQNEMIVAGCDAASGPMDRFMGVVSKAHYMASRTAGGEGRHVMMVPVITFGQTGSYLFYIESMHRWRIIDPFFINTAHQFIALRLLPAVFKGDKNASQRYAQRMEETGIDPNHLLELEPLIRQILGDAPEEVHPETIKQIGAEILFRLNS